MTTRADRHDIDKLARWQKDLTGPATRQFPVYVVFLVSEADQAAHDVFRAFRRSFESRNAGFGNLVIFGQHGVSSTVHAVLSRLGLPVDLVPLLVLFTPFDEPVLRVLRLPEGDAGPIADAPAELLSRVEQSLDGTLEHLDDSGLEGVKRVDLPDAHLPALVDQLMGEVG